MNFQDSCTYDDLKQQILWTSCIKIPSDSSYRTASKITPNGKIVTYTVNQNTRWTIQVDQDADGDIIEMRVFLSNTSTFLYSVKATYLTTPNKFKEFYREFELVDPFCRLNHFDVKTGAGYPLNLHYETKCLKKFEVVYPNGTIVSNNFQYDFNDGGYITSIRINNKLFRTFEYVPK